MATAVQSIILDPSKLFDVAADDLRSELKTSPRSQIKALMKAVSNQEWLLHLPPEQQLQCEKTLLLTLPRHTPRDCLDVFLGIFKELDVPNREDDFGVEMMRTNRGMALESIRAHFLQEFPKVDPSDDLLLLYLIREEYIESGASKYLKLVLKDGIDLRSSINGEDLLFVVAEDGSAEDLQLTLDYYKMNKGDGYRSFLSEKMEELIELNLDCPDKMLVLMRACLGARLEPMMWLKRIDWVQEPTCFDVVKRWLDPSSIREFYQAYGMQYLLKGAMADEATWVYVLEILRSAGLKPKDFFPPRTGNVLTPMEKALLMMGKREACKRVVKLVGNDSGLKIAISRSDRLYRNFEANRSRDHLNKLYLQIKEKMKLPLTPRKNKMGIVSLIDREKFREIWKNKELIELVDQFLSIAIVEAFYIFRDSYEKSGRNAREMKKLLHNQLDDGPHYIHCFFHRSFVNVYHYARGMCTLVPRFYFNPALKRDDEEPFFTPGTPQYRWRQMYNSLQVVMDMYGLTHMHANYINWTEPDLQFKVPPKGEKRIGTPTLIPSYWMCSLSQGV